MAVQTGGALQIAQLVAYHVVVVAIEEAVAVKVQIHRALTRHIEVVGHDNRRVVVVVIHVTTLRQIQGVVDVMEVIKTIQLKSGAGTSFCKDKLVVGDNEAGIRMEIFEIHVGSVRGLRVIHKITVADETHSVQIGILSVHFAQVDILLHAGVGIHIHREGVVGKVGKIPSPDGCDHIAEMHVVVREMQAAVISGVAFQIHSVTGAGDIVVFNKHGTAGKDCPAVVGVVDVGESGTFLIRILRSVANDLAVADPDTVAAVKADSNPVGALHVVVSLDGHLLQNHMVEAVAEGHCGILSGRVVYDHTVGIAGGRGDGDGVLIGCTLDGLVHVQAVV